MGSPPCEWVSQDVQTTSYQNPSTLDPLLDLTQRAMSNNRYLQTGAFLKEKHSSQKIKIKIFRKDAWTTK